MQRLLTRTAAPVVPSARAVVRNRKFTNSSVSRGGGHGDHGAHGHGELSHEMHAYQATQPQFLGGPVSRFRADTLILVFHYRAPHLADVIAASPHVWACL